MSANALSGWKALILIREHPAPGPIFAVFGANKIDSARAILEAAYLTNQTTIFHRKTAWCCTLQMERKRDKLLLLCESAKENIWDLPK